jgi:hypothetical protein
LSGEGIPPRPARQSDNHRLVGSEINHTTQASRQYIIRIGHFEAHAEGTAGCVEHLIDNCPAPYNWSTWFEIFNDDVEVLGWQGSDIPTRMY